MFNLAKKDPFENAGKLFKKIDDAHPDENVPKILVGTQFDAAKNLDA